MEIDKNRVVGIHYKLTDPKGQLIDTSDEMSPFYFLFGTGAIVPGLEKQLKGKKEGDSFKAIIPPEEAYGACDDAMTQKVPRQLFEDVDEIKLGMQFEVETELGSLVVSVREIEDDFITVDGNHPMAGITLHFDVNVMAVREATSEELEHGHVHTSECDLT